MGHVNVGDVSVRDATDFLCEYVRDAAPHAIAISECKCRDNAFWRALRTNLRAKAMVAHRPLGSTSVPSGGVAIVLLRPDLYNMSLLWRDERGALAVLLQRRDKTALPLVLVCAYLPPDGSPVEHFFQPLLLALAERLSCYLREYRDVLLAGDFNTRLGTQSIHSGEGPRHTADTHAPGSTRANTLRRALRDLGLSPLLGRTASLPAYITSYPINGRDGGAEVDYIIGRASTRHDRFTAAPPLSRRALPKYVTHRPLLISYDLSHCPGPAPGTATTPRTRWRVPPYRDKRYFSLGERLMSSLTSPVLQSLLRSPDPSVLNSTFLGRVLTEALDSCMLADHDRPHRPAVALLRRPLPREFLTRYIAPLREAKRAARANEHTPNEALHAANVKAAGKAAHRAIARRIRDHRAEAERQRCNDTHRLFTHTLRDVAPVTGGYGLNDNFMPDEPGKPPAVQRAFDFFNDHLFNKDTPVPPATHDPEWLCHVPGADGSALLAHCAWKEVYLILFPANKRVVPAHCPGGGATSGCALCSVYCATHASWEGGLAPGAPLWTPRVHTSKAPGDDDIAMEFLRWARVEDPKARMALRVHMCTTLARLYNAILTTGDIPSSILSFYTILLQKPSRSGAPVNAADPDLRRAITVGRTVHKILGLITMARVVHWTLRCRLVSPAQGGFVPMHGGDWQPFAFIETIKAAWRAGRDVFVLFIDFRKAYDSVHPTALLAVLKKMGVPPPLLRVLECEIESRTTHLRVNGTVSATMPMSIGLGQGDVKSPTLWNCFVESLTHYLASLPGVMADSVRVGGTATPIALFADDGVCPQLSPEGVQRTANAVFAWARAWGMELGIGPGKTQAMAFRRPSSPRPYPHVPDVVLPDGRIVPYTEQYRYLGAPLDSSLRLDALISRGVAVMRANHERYVQSNSLVPDTSPALAFQIIGTCIAGSAIYLQALVTCSSAVRRRYNSVIIVAARRVLRHSRYMPSTGVLADLRISTPGAHAPRERMRLYYQLLLTPLADSFAPRTFHALRGAGLRATHRPDASWIPHTEAFLRKVEAATGVTTVPQSLADIHRATAVAARAYEFALWRKDALNKCDASVCHALQRPRCGPPCQHLCDLFFGYATLPTSLGEADDATPLSCIGPGCSGNVLSLVAEPLPPHLTSAIVHARVGKMALFDGPLAVPPWLRTWRSQAERRDGDGDSDDDDAPPADGGWASRACRAAPCPLCAMPSVDPLHVLCECTDPATVSLRAEITSGVPSLIAALFRDLVLADHRARRISQPDLPHEPEGLDGAVAAVTDEVRSTRWGSPAGRFLLHRLLIVMPWSERAVFFPSPLRVHPLLPDAPVTWRLGILFDATALSNQYLRSFAVRWVRWAGPRVLELCKTWARSAGAHPPPLAPPSPP